MTVNRQRGLQAHVREGQPRPCASPGVFTPQDALRESFCGVCIAEQRANPAKPRHGQQGFVGGRGVWVWVKLAVRSVHCSCRCGSCATGTVTPIQVLQRASTCSRPRMRQRLYESSGHERSRSCLCCYGHAEHSQAIIAVYSRGTCDQIGRQPGAEGFSGRMMISTS